MNPQKKGNSFIWTATELFCLVFLMVCLISISGCASKSATEVLDDALQEQQSPEAANPEQTKLMDLLRSKGYQGIGLEYESPETLDLLQRVFLDSRTDNRKIKLVYTGLYLSYDRKYQSLTIGGTQDSKKVLSYISRKIPKRPKK